MEPENINQTINITNYGTVNIKYKTCTKCKLSKSLLEYYKDKGKKDGLYCYCKSCSKHNKKIYYNNNKDKIKEYYEDNREHLLDYNKQWRNNNKEYIKQYQNNRYHTDFNFKMKKCLSSRLTNLFSNQKHSATLSNLLDCSDNFLKSWIIYQFNDKMSENNYGIYYHIDHVLPISRFNMNDEYDRKLIWNWKNLKPLEKIENIRKSNRLDIQLYNKQLINAKKFITLWNSIEDEKLLTIFPEHSSDNKYYIDSLISG